MTHRNKLFAIIILVAACTQKPAENVIDWKVADLPNIERIEGSPQTVTEKVGDVAYFGGSGCVTENSPAAVTRINGAVTSLTIPPRTVTTAGSASSGTPLTVSANAAFTASPSCVTRKSS